MSNFRRYWQWWALGGTLLSISVCVFGTWLVIQPYLFPPPDVFPGGIVKKDDYASSNWLYGYRRDQVIELPRDSDGVYPWYLQQLQLPPRGTRNSESCLSAEGRNATAMGEEFTGVVVCIAEDHLLVVINQQYDYSRIRPYFTVRGWQSLLRDVF